MSSKYRVKIKQHANNLLAFAEHSRGGDSEKLAELRSASFRLLMELRRGHSSIWLLDSERFANAKVLYDPPLRMHFQLSQDGTIEVIDFEDMQSSV